MRILITVVLLLINSLALAELDIQAAVVPEAPPTAKVLTSYMTLKNNGTEARKLVSFSSPQFERVELHKTEHSDGMARMVAVDSITLVPGETATLEAGGLHLMMFTPAARYKAGDGIELILHFADGSEQELRVPVEKRKTTDSHQHHHH